MGSSEIQNFYDGTNIFITGATGFMGKVLVEKLLRSCPNINKIYMLMREKKGKKIEERITDIINAQCFDRLKRERPAFKDQLIPIAGDIDNMDVGLSKHDRELLEQEVDIVFHVAATVKFNEQLDVAIKQNVRGTREVLLLCKTFKRIKSVVHVSTAFSHCPSSEIDERFYDSPIDCDQAIDMAENLSSETLVSMTPKLLGKWPNTYSFTKAIAEDVVDKYGRGLPVGLFRPSVVICTRDEPMPGWVDNMYGPGGYVASYLYGVLRTSQCLTSNIANIVPCDMAINAMIVTAWNVSKCWSPSSDVKVFNYVSPKGYETTWGDYLYTYGKLMANYPYSKAVWYPMIIMTTNNALYSVFKAALHYIPGAMMDGLLIITGNKPRMIRSYKIIHQFTDMISYFSNRSWKYGDQNIERLWNELDEEDKKVFRFDMRTIDWKEYFNTTFHGLRKYLLRDDPSTIPAARIRMRRLYVLHRLTQALLIFSLAYQIKKLINRRLALRR